jgi:hypothetical protein
MMTVAHALSVNQSVRILLYPGVHTWIIEWTVPPGTVDHPGPVVGKRQLTPSNHPVCQPIYEHP